MKKTLNFIVISGLLIILYFCSSPQKETQKPFADTLVNYSVTAAQEWTNLFYRKNGWFGADGVFTMALTGKESFGVGAEDSVLMYFSDTMTGTVLADTAVANFKMINNSFAWVTGLEPSEETVKLFYRQGINNEPLNHFKPNTPNTQPGEYYWFGDGFVNQQDNNSINIFGYRVFDNSRASWDFEVRGVTLITIPAGASFSEHTQIDLPLFMEIDSLGKGTFGSGIYVNTKEAGAPNPDGYLYIYGLLDPNKQLVVARVKPENIKEVSTWRFWNGKQWDEKIENVKPVTNRVSNEVSLTPMKDGRYLLVFQSDGIGQYTSIRIGESPIGPFGPLQNIWKAPEITAPPGIIPYNAKAHPVLSSTDRLLISYNTISMDYFNDILKHPHMYRPRFFWLEIIE
ncbi:DUF4185 domain-containing protein [Fulvivirga sp. M361]|uniref:DUF4185 domain-containing protein n=1 Tax=Fulvivirga sp. M361 TaxID=2594266 RepID=UPI00117B2A8C|nr:DUF4185 domain-containing protein [Fulvivirga sp. M361]TRX59594.1 DUF4185 domain-containing protein [Fulvivirga sp. M361]